MYNYCLHLVPAVEFLYDWNQLCKCLRFKKHNKFSENRSEVLSHEM